MYRLTQDAPASAGMSPFELNCAQLKQMSVQYMIANEPGRYIIEQCPECFREKKSMMPEGGKYLCQCGQVLYPSKIIRKWTA